MSAAPLRPSHSKAIALGEVFEAPVVPAAAVEVAVTGITLDSRSVLPGDLYVALPGVRAHGAAFATAAAQSGAVAVLTDDAGREQALQSGLPVVVVEKARAAMATAAAAIHHHPARQLRSFAVTGTNGKTSTVFLLEAALRSAGRHVGTIGTNGFRLDGQELISGRTTVTTPESPDLQALLAVFLERGATDVAMEVSSHGLDLQRTDGIVFDIVGFTNLGRDHLDYHADMEDYFRAKAKLFEPARSGVAVVNIDGHYGQRLADQIAERGQPRLVTTGFAASDYQILESTSSADGNDVILRARGDDLRLTLQMPGDFNAQNAALALAMLIESGLPGEKVMIGLCEAQVPGRMQRVPLGDDAPMVLVDFAHTPQAVASALASLHPSGRLIAVLGCGGDRDRAKRGPMGEAAASAADVVIVTDDNPRTEDPASIRAVVLAGARSVDSGAQVVEQDGRASAIRRALDIAGPGDVVAILGKGHEQGQILADRVIDFDDVTVVQQAWHELWAEV